MSGRKEIVIQDACIIFDLVDYGLLDVFFNLNIEVWTTRQVLFEIRKDEQYKKLEPFVISKAVCLDTQASLEDILAWSDMYPGLGVADHSVLELAKRKSATILTADGGIRKAALAHGIPLHGLVWIMTEMCYKKLISPREILEKLHRYSEENDRSPKSEIKSLINKIKEDFLL